MAVCANCGSENPDNSRFCGNCGQALAAAEDPTSGPPEDQGGAAPEDAGGPPSEVPGTPPASPEEAAYNEALAAINQPPSAGAPPSDHAAATEQQPPATEQLTPAGQMPTTPLPPSPPPVTPTTPMGGPSSGMPPGTPPGGSKKALLIAGGVVGLLLILGAVWFFFIRDDSAPARPDVQLGEETDEDDEDVPTEETPDEGADLEGDTEVAYDAIEPYLATEAGPYSLTQTSSEPCEPPCIFPPEAHNASVETFQATWDAGTPESEIYGEFLRYGSVDDASVGHEIVAAELESIGYQQIDTFTIQGVPGAVYQSPEDEVLLWLDSNLIMGLHGNKGYPVEFVGYLGP